LRVASQKGPGESRLQNLGDCIFSLENLQSALPGAKALKQEDEVNLEFFCDIDFLNAILSRYEALSAQGYETNFEMNREIVILKPPTSSSPSEKTMECFSLHLDDPISKTIVADIEKIITGEFKQPEECLSESELAAEKSDCTELIKQLEAIVTKYDK
uniref:Interleukin-1 beta n=1 Tax=Rodentolepis nana TaxID=102285 RepID=A0A0R3TBE5_RODNA